MLHSTCSAPAKIILSGEHSILYGCPALSLSIQLFSHCHVTYSPSENLTFHLQLSDFQFSRTLNHLQFNHRAQQIEQRYQAFLNEGDQTTIEDVLTAKEDLLIVALSQFQQQVGKLKTGNWQIEISSDIPVGRGLGSSASVIISLLKALVQLHDNRLNTTQLLELAKAIESRQHGKSSGLDPITILHGGLIEYRRGKPPIQHPPKPFKAWLIDTGQPSSSTGQAVTTVQQRFAHNQTIWQAFSDTTESLIEAWKKQDAPTLLQLIEQNQLLLQSIGVVPDKVASFITELKTQYSATAKVCGSGASHGDQAGVLLCVSDQEPDQLCKQYGYPYQPIQIDVEGAKCQ